MQRTDPDRAGLASRLELGRDGRQEGGPLRDDRKALAKMLAEKGLASRPIAEILGVHHSTIAEDLRVGNPTKTVGKPTTDTDSTTDRAAAPDPDRARNDERAAEVAVAAAADRGCEGPAARQGRQAGSAITTAPTDQRPATLSR